MKHPSIISTDRFLLISFILCITGSLLIYQQIDRQYTRSNLVTHSYIIKVTLNQFLLNLTEAQTNQRGYLLTHDPDFLTSFQRAIRKARFIVVILDSLTLDDPGQQESLFKLRQAFNNSILTLQANMLLPLPATQPAGAQQGPHRAGGPGAQPAMAQPATAQPAMAQPAPDDQLAGAPALDDPSDAVIDHTKDILDNLRNDAYSMLDAENTLLQQRIQERDSLIKKNPYYMLLTGVLIISLIVFVYLKLKKETLLRLDSEQNTAALEKKDFQRTRELARLNEKLTMQNNVFLHAEKIALIGSYTWNLSTGEMSFSDNLYRMLGYEPGEFTPAYDQLLQFVHPSDKAEILKGTPFALESIIQTEAPCRFLTKEGVIKYFRATGKYLFQPGGEVIAGTFQDITKDIELRQALENNDNFIRSLLDIAPNTITIFDLERSATVFSSHPRLPTLGHRMDNGADPDESPFALIHPDDREAAIQYLQSLKGLQDREVLEFEYRVKNGDGSYTYLMSRNTPYKRNSRLEIIQILGATIDITEKVKAQLEVKAKTEALLRNSFEQQSAKRFKTLADSMPQIVWTADAGGRIDYFNQRWYSYTQLPERTLSMTDLSGNIHPEDVREYFDNWTRSLETGYPFQVEFRFKDQYHRDQYCWLLAKALPIHDQNGIITKWHGTFTDINDLKLAQLSIQQLVKEKEDFISIASHELKTPVTSLKGSIQLLERLAGEGTLPGEMDGLIQMAVRQVNKLSRMVGDLLDVARMDADKIELVKRDFLLMEAISDSLEQVRYLSARSAIHVNGPTNVLVHSNKERIEQVITNFLSNAIKYSPEGSDILVEPSLCDGHLRVAVTDHGIGIPASKLPFVFDRFFRVEASSDKFSGLGLGLYISAEIISKLQGDIGVTSDPGKGSTFWFTLPVT